MSSRGPLKLRHSTGAGAEPCPTVAVQLPESSVAIETERLLETESREGWKIPTPVVGQGTLLDKENFVCDWGFKP